MGFPRLLAGFQERDIWRRRRKGIREPFQKNHNFSFKKKKMFFDTLTIY